MEVWKIIFLFINGWFVGSILIFQGVCFEGIKQTTQMYDYLQPNVWLFWIGNIKTRWWFQICFIFTPLFGEDEPILTNISKGLVQPPTRKVVCEIKKIRWFSLKFWILYIHFFGKNEGGEILYLYTSHGCLVYLHEWLIFKCFHVGKYTNRQPWMCLGLVLNMNRVNKFQLLSSRVKPTVFHVMFRGIGDWWVHMSQMRKPQTDKNENSIVHM